MHAEGAWGVCMQWGCVECACEGVWSERAIFAENGTLVAGGVSWGFSESRGNTCAFRTCHYCGKWHAQNKNVTFFLNWASLCRFREKRQRLQQLVLRNPCFSGSIIFLYKGSDCLKSLQACCTILNHISRHRKNGIS